MEPFYKNRWFYILIFSLLSLLVIYMLIQVKPLIIWFYHFLSAVLGPFAVAMIISYVLNPIVSMLNKRKVPRTAAVLLIYAVFIASAVVILMNLIPMFVKQLTELNEHLPDLAVRAQSLVDQLNDNRLPPSVRAGINKALATMENGISAGISGYINRIGSTINTIFIAFIIPFMAFYMLKDFHLIERTVMASVPKPHRKRAVRLLFEIDGALGSYIRGQFIVCVIVGVLSWIGYWMVGMQYPLLLAAAVSVTNIVPYLGPYLGAAPALLMAAMISWKMVLYVLIVNTSIQILESNVISPQVVGRTLHLHPLSIILAILIGGELGGVMGLIVAVPLFAVLKVVVQHFFVYYTQSRRT